jgi:hypothetical protein
MPHSVLAGANAGSTKPPQHDQYRRASFGVCTAPARHFLWLLQAQQSPHSEGMNSLTSPLPPLPVPPSHTAVPLALQWKRQPLPPLQAVQVLDFAAGDTALLEVEHGRVWVTCDGLLEDYFLEAGQRLTFTGPVRLRVSAEGQRPARLNWARYTQSEGATLPARRTAGQPWAMPPARAASA